MVESENKLPASFQAVLRSALPKRGIRSIEMLKGGSTNLNALIRLQNSDDTFVLRRYLHCRHVCEKEVYLLRFLQGVIPIPELVNADASGKEAGEPYILYRYLDGVTFRQIRAAGTGQDLATAAHALGVCLGQLQGVLLKAEAFASYGILPRKELTEANFSSVVLAERLGSEDFNLLQKLFLTSSHRLRELSRARHMVHGDFNHRNAIFQRRNGKWEVIGILDWELACTGSPLWDVARFVCYEKVKSPCCEPHFTNGFTITGGDLPRDWATFHRVLNTMSAAESMCSMNLQPQFIPELRQLIHNGVRGRQLA